MAQHALALRALLQPAAQTWPGTGERLVGELDAVRFGRHQPRLDEPVDELLGRCVAAQHAGVEAAPHDVALGGWRDEPQQQGTQQASLVRVERVVHAVGGTGDRAAYATRSRGSPRS